MMYTLALGSIIALELGLVALAVFIFRSIWQRDSLYRRLMQNFLLTFFTILFMITFLEIGLNLFFIQTDAINFTLTSQRWYERYWQPINSLGYRDDEWTPEKINGRKRIVVVGDSFATGWGLERIEERFSNQLGNKLGDDYVVMTVAQNGWGTQDELEGLKAFPYPPDIIIFSYYLNDIEPIAGTLGFSRPANLLIHPPGWLRPLVEHSHLFNFVYWRLFRWRAFASPLQRPEIQSYQAYLRMLYEDPNVWMAHQEELGKVYQQARDNNQQLILVVFPDMLKVEKTHDLSKKVVDFFQDLDVPVVDVAALVMMKKPEKLIVNSVDSHPSAEVHTLVANALYSTIFELAER